MLSLFNRKWMHLESYSTHLTLNGDSMDLLRSRFMVKWSETHFPQGGA